MRNERESRPKEKELVCSKIKQTISTKTRNAKNENDNLAADVAVVAVKSRSC